MYSSRRHYGLLLLLTLLLAGCAPRVQGPGSAGVQDDPRMAAVDRAARAAWHRMELSLLETGSYTTNALVDLQLPKGARWTLVDFSGDSYTLAVTSTELPGLVWTITPSGVTLRRGG